MDRNHRVPPTTHKPPPPVRALTLAIGSLASIVIGAFTPLNDYVLNNTPVIGSALPTAVVLALLLGIVLLNTPLRRYRPRRALTSGELTIILAMALVACAVPAGGVMRYLVGHITGLQILTAEDDRYRQLLHEADLPAWLFPTFSTDLANRAADPVLRDFAGRVPLHDPTWWDSLLAVPWLAWVPPLLAWGTLCLLLAAALIAMALLFRRQWSDNERLPFPLAGIYIALVEDPRPGSLLNPTLSSHSFWICAGLVFIAHAFAGLHTYFPRFAPEVPLGFDLRTILSSGAWTYVEDDFKRAQVYFTLVGITYFLSQKVAFSLWFFFVLLQLTRVGYGNWEMDFSDNMQRDQLFGAVFPYAAAFLFVARAHLARVARLMFSPPTPNDPAWRYLPDGIAGWTLLLSSAGIVAWLCLVGVSLLSAISLVAIMLLFFLVVARVVAETGMPYVGLYLPLTLPMSYLAASLPAGLSAKAPARDFLTGQLLSGLFAHDHRESLPLFASHALKVADSTLPSPDHARRFLPALAASLLLAFLVSFAAWLVVEYRFSTPLDRNGGGAVVNVWAAYLQPRYFTYEPTLAHLASSPELPQPHNRLAHFGFGAAAMSLLSFLRLRYEAFPLHPVGYLMCFTLGLKWVWFSIFLGWLAKSAILRLGGASLYRNAMPAFLGLILGEIAAAGFWLAFNLARLSLGFDFVQVKLLQG
jgi:hypothetical protein